MEIRLLLKKPEIKPGTQRVRRRNTRWSPHCAIPQIQFTLLCPKLWSAEIVQLLIIAINLILCLLHASYCWGVYFFPSQHRTSLLLMVTKLPRRTRQERWKNSMFIQFLRNIQKRILPGPRDPSVCSVTICSAQRTSNQCWHGQNLQERSISD